MIRLFNILSIVFVLLVTLISCAGIDQPAASLEAGAYDGIPLIFTAWQPLESSRSPVAANQAVRELLKQADTLIANNALEQASDKLERLLRIEPAYAQAWSRLAWIAIQGHSPQRGRQMAQRSNSLAYDNKRLKALNWMFIQQASKLMNDAAGAREAEIMMQRLGGGV